MACPEQPVFQPLSYNAKRGYEDPRISHCASPYSSPRSSSPSSHSDADSVLSPCQSPDDITSPTKHSITEDSLLRARNNVLTPKSSLSHSQIQPIAIEQPSRRKSGGDEGDITDTPLSGRGDREGGYFPLHEDPQKRIKRSHPFHADAESARRESISRAQRQSSIVHSDLSSSLGTAPKLTTTQASLPEGPPLFMPSKSPIRAKPPPFIADMPVSAPDTALPLGKYYPTNYEARQKKAREQHKSQSSHLSPDKATSIGTRMQHRPSHNRSASEASRKLQQYQRDMVAQASLRATQLLGKTAGITRDISVMTARVPPSMLGTVPLETVQGSLRLQSHGDLSPPRLQPLGSPGGESMTPMELGSLSRLHSHAGTPLGSPDVERESDEIAKALEAEAELQKRAGGLSPGIGAGGQF